MLVQAFHQLCLYAPGPQYQYAAHSAPPHFVCLCQGLQDLFRAYLCRELIQHWTLANPNILIVQFCRCALFSLYDSLPVLP